MISFPGESSAPSWTGLGGLQQERDTFPDGANQKQVAVQSAFSCPGTVLGLSATVMAPGRAERPGRLCGLGQTLRFLFLKACFGV